jgi:hypothetical protein
VRFLQFLGGVLVIAAGLLCAPAQESASGRIIKVLPQYVDLKGRHTLSPSLYERDAYQYHLRQNPQERSGLRFAVQFKLKHTSSASLKLRLELRGSAQTNTPNEMFLETHVKEGHWWTQWTELTLTGARYQQFGELTAWRATLWQDDRLLSEQKSFLW